MFSLKMDMQPWTMWQIHLKSGGKISLASLRSECCGEWPHYPGPNSSATVEATFCMLVVWSLEPEGVMLLLCVVSLRNAFWQRKWCWRGVKHIIASKAGNGIHTQLMGNAAHIRSIQCIPSNSNQTASFALNLVTLNEDYDQLSWVCPFGIMKYYTT